jgi:hypothetical protein
MVEVDSTQFNRKIAEYIRLTGKSLAVAIREQAALLAQALTKLTYPASAAQGKRRVEIDVNKVFLKPSWFEDKFQFRNKKLGDRVKGAIRAKDEADLKGIFSHSGKLSLIRVEPFSPANHAKLRRNGRVLVPDPRSFPVREASKVKSYIAERKKNVGTAKAGWAQTASKLGKSQPAWLSKPGVGEVSDKSEQENHPHVTLTNRVGYFAQLDSKAGIVGRALIGRGKAMIASAKKQLAEASRRVGFN